MTEPSIISRRRVMAVRDYMLPIYNARFEEKSFKLVLKHIYVEISNCFALVGSKKYTPFLIVWVRTV